MKKNKKIFIIAEIGVNHNNDMKLAKKLINIAKKIGADAVKFQTFSADKLAKRYTPKVPYQKRSGSKIETHYQMLKKLELSKENHIFLKKYCKIKKIEFISTPYNLSDIIFLEKIGIKKFKIASADIVDHQMHTYLAKKNYTVIISTGMASMQEISSVVKIYKKFKNKKFSLLHCVSSYPCSDKSLNLMNIISLKNKFKCPVGFSDHSVGNLASVMSVGYGVSIIEKHFTLNKKFKGPDHLASSDPNEFKSLIVDIRRAENIRGKNLKRVQSEEISMKKISRKSMVYNKDIKKGHKLTNEDIDLIRPGDGLLGDKINLFIGKKINKNVRKSENIKFSHIK